MKKFLKLISINILSLVIIIFLLEVIGFFIYYSQTYKNIQENKKSPAFVFSSIYLGKFEHLYFNNDEIRKPNIKNNILKNEKGSIVLLGCSFTYGNQLNYEDTFSSFLSEETNRNVYNLGISGGSMREMLYILRTKELLYHFIPKQENVKFVIYTFLPGHNQRNFINTRPFAPIFKLTKNHQLEYVKFNNFTQRSRMLSVIKNYLVSSKFSDIFLHQYVYIKEINKEIKKCYKDAKFIILIYDKNNSKIKTDLFKNEDIIFINLFDLTGVNLEDNKYKTEDNFHPNDKAWKIIVPALVKELNL